MKDVVKLILELADQQINIFLEDGKLKIDAPTGVSLDTVISKIRLHREEIIEYLSDDKHRAVTIEQAPLSEDYPLSSAQRRLWVLSQFEEGSLAYNIPGVFIFEGELDSGALSGAFETLIERHESLRTVFREVSSGEIRQHILKAPETGFQIAHHDVRNEGEAAIMQAVYAHLAERFNLENGPLLRAALYQATDTKWVFSYVMHHIISDGWSMDVLLKELMQLYNASVQQISAPLQPLDIQYKDYAVWQQQQLSDEKLVQHKDYWLKQFSGELPVLGLPLDRVRPAIKSYNGASITYTISPDISTRLQALCQSSDSTLFMGLLSAVNVLLYRYTGQEDIVVGSPVAGREHAELHDQIGFYVNTLALRTQIDSKDTYRQLLAKVRQITIDAYQHQAYPFDELLEVLQVQRDMSRNALFDVLVVLQQQPGFLAGEKAFSGLRIKAVEHEASHSKVDLQFTFVDNGDGLQLHIAYNTDIYVGSTIERMAGHLGELLNVMTADPEQVLSTLDYLGVTERGLLLDTFNATAVTYPQDKTIIDLFVIQSQKTPDRPAVIFDDKIFTYQQLHQLSGQFAIYLAQVYPVKPGDLVAIGLERSEWLPVVILGILKTGAAYVPIDTHYPQERIDYILKDGNCGAYIDAAELEKFIFVQDTYDAAFTPVHNHADDIAYCIYTSGSTGTPKGVLNSHAGLYNRLLWMRDYLQVKEDDVFLQKTPYTFDVSVWELLLPFITGSALVIAGPDKHKDPAYLQDIIYARGITIAHFVPSMLGIFLLDVTDLKCGALKHIVCSGEELPASMVLGCREKVPGARIHNFYGPTEAAIDVTAIDLTTIDIQEQGVTIGRPVANTKIYIVNDSLQLQPVGVPGELLISGVQVAKGYMHLDELTAAKFIADPFAEGHRVYRTGDLARWLPDGTIQYLGRSDDQVKIRGNRIELGEIEKMISSFDGIEQGVALAKDVNGEKALVAYYKLSAAIDKTALKQYLAQRLPEYMVPAYYIALEDVPLTVSGKVNRKALPGIGDADIIHQQYIAPRNTTEQALAGIWEEILNRPRIGIKDRFFELGGHSLKATRLASKIHKVLGVKVPLKTLFTVNTIEEQAALINQDQQSLFESIPVAPQQEDYPVSSSQRRLWVLSQFEEGSVAYHMPAAFAFEGTPDINALSKALGQLIARHESLRTVFMQDEQGELRQRILPVPVDTFEISRHLVKTDDDIEQLLRAHITQPFDLAKGPLLRANLYQTGEGSWVFSYVMHHIISDGWSMEVLMKELMTLYNAYVEGEPDPLIPLPIHYKDYASWQQTSLQNVSAQQHSAYWLKQFAGEIPVLELPADNLRPAVKTYNGAVQQIHINAETTEALKELCNAGGSTLFMALLAVVKTLLYRYSGQDDIVVGTPVAGREHSDLEGQIGFYVNTLALRTQFSGKDSYLQLLSNIKQVTLDAYQHQSYPFDTLVEALQLRRDTSRSSLFDVLLVLQQRIDTLEIENGFSGLKIRSINGMQQHSKFDLQFAFAEKENGIELRLVYNPDIYQDATARRLLRHFNQLLEAIVSTPDKAINQLSYLDVAEQEAIFNFNKLSTQVLPVSIVDAFRRQVHLTPGNDALVYKETILTYKELDVVSDKLSAYLQDVYQVKPGDFIGIQLERSEWMIIALWSVLKSGAAFVPIDPHYPQERIAYILSDSKCRIVIDDTMLAKYQATGDAYSAMQRITVHPDSLAYVIYTSGSTGRPKGVMIQHGALYHYITAVTSEYGCSADDSILQVSSFSFDAAIEQMMLSALNGAVLHVVSRELATDTTGLSAYIRDNAITHVHTVPTLLQQLDLSDAGSLKRVVSAGEACPVSLVQRIKDNITFYNKYGPTEATISATLYKVINKNILPATVPIGYPLGNSSVYVLDEYRNIVPVGVKGEICIGGHSLASGYLHQDELTAEKFIEDPYHSGQRLYCTGDLGRWQADGSLLFIGRKDEQVKIRGHRIEPGEISRVLEEYEGVKTAVVTCIKDNRRENLLVAYLAGTAINTDEIRSWLGGRLPHYMVPAHLIVLDTIPLTANGKIDKKALPPADEYLQTTAVYLAPETPVQEQLVDIWKRVLKMEQIGIRDNFFELGGHSLHITRMLYEINNVFDIKLQMKNVFASQTICELAGVIEDEIIFKNGIAIDGTEQIINEKTSEIWEI